MLPSAPPRPTSGEGLSSFICFLSYSPCCCSLALSGSPLGKGGMRENLPRICMMRLQPGVRTLWVYPKCGCFFRFLGGLPIPRDLPFVATGHGNAFTGVLPSTPWFPSLCWLPLLLCWGARPLLPSCLLLPLAPSGAHVDVGLTSPSHRLTSWLTCLPPSLGTGTSLYTHPTSKRHESSSPLERLLKDCLTSPPHEPSTYQ